MMMGWLLIASLTAAPSAPVPPRAPKEAPAPKAPMAPKAPASSEPPKKPRTPQPRQHSKRPPPSEEELLMLRNREFLEMLDLLMTLPMLAEDEELEDEEVAK